MAENGRRKKELEDLFTRRATQFVLSQMWGDCLGSFHAQDCNHECAFMAKTWRIDCLRSAISNFKGFSISARYAMHLDLWNSVHHDSQFFEQASWASKQASKGKLRSSREEMYNVICESEVPLPVTVWSLEALQRLPNTLYTSENLLQLPPQYLPQSVKYVQLDLQSFATVVRSSVGQTNFEFHKCLWFNSVNSLGPLLRGPSKRSVIGLQGYSMAPCWNKWQFTKTRLCSENFHSLILTVRCLFRLKRPFTYFFRLFLD